MEHDKTHPAEAAIDDLRADLADYMKLAELAEAAGRTKAHAHHLEKIDHTERMIETLIRARAAEAAVEKAVELQLSVTQFLEDSQSLGIAEDGRALAELNVDMNGGIVLPVKDDAADLVDGNPSLGRFAGVAAAGVGIPAVNEQWYGWHVLWGLVVAMLRLNCDELHISLHELAEDVPEKTEKWERMLRNAAGWSTPMGTVVVEMEQEVVRLSRKMPELRRGM